MRKYFILFIYVYILLYVNKSLIISLIRKLQQRDMFQNISIASIVIGQLSRFPSLTPIAA